MSVYIIGQLKFTDKSRYRRYQHRFADVFSRFNGQLLCADESPLSLEGTWNKDKIVIMCFADESEAQLFLQSPEYIEISKDREAGADTVSLMAKSFDTTIL